MTYGDYHTQHFGQRSGWVFAESGSSAPILEIVVKRVAVLAVSYLLIDALEVQRQRRHKKDAFPWQKTWGTLFISVL